MQNAIICGNYGANNVGDEAILLSTLQLLNGKYGSFTIFSGCPTKTSTIYGVESVRFVPTGFRSIIRAFKTYPKTHKAFKQADVFILGGGGLMQDEDKKACWIWFIQVLFAKLYGLRIEVYRNSIGPLNTWKGRFLTKKVLQFSDKISVRDKKSRQYAKELAPSKKVELLKDPVLEYKPKDYYKENQIAISLRHWYYFEGKTISELKKVVDYIIENTSLNIMLIPFGLKDSEILKQLQESSTERIKLLTYTDHVKNVLKTVSESKLLIGMRLHSLIFAHICKTPFIGLSYTDKVIEFCKSINQEDNCFELKDVDSEEIISRIKKFI